MFRALEAVLDQRVGWRMNYWLVRSPVCCTLIKRAWREIDVKEVIKSQFWEIIPGWLEVQAVFFTGNGKN
jgi:hypothetical protein